MEIHPQLKKKKILYMCYTYTHIERESGRLGRWYQCQKERTMTFGHKDERIVTGRGDIICFKVWDVPKSNYYPEGKKFSFVFIHQNRRILGYDNSENKGCHKHYIDLDSNEEIEIKIDECNIKKIFHRFKKEIGQLVKELYE